MADTFNQTVKQGSGSYAGDYLWSTTGNWSTNALPASGDAVTLNLKQAANAAVVDGPISVASVLFNSSGSLLIGGSLSTGSITVASGVTGEALSVLSSGSLRMTGTLNLSGGTLDIAGTASINGLALNNTSLTIEGAMTVAQLGGGSISINRGGTLEITTQTSSSLSSGGDIFTLNGGSLKLDSGVTLLVGTSFTFGAVSTYGVSKLNLADLPSNVGSYNGFSYAINAVAVGDSFEIGTTTFGSATYTASGHSLALNGSNGTPNYTLTNINLAASSGALSFGLSTAADGGTLITLNCFLSGTRIETAAGAVPIEALSTGDLVVTIQDGAHVLRPVRWTGAREVDFNGMDDDAARDAAPVRIRAHAFAENVPARDLLVTADHCVFEAGGLVPARMLVNGASILRDTDRIGYRVHHLEFDVHSILLSEGLTTESYLDTSGRAGFGPDANAPTRRDLGGGCRRTAADRARRRRADLAAAGGTRRGARHGCCRPEPRHPDHAGSGGAPAPGGRHAAARAPLPSRSAFLRAATRLGLRHAAVAQRDPRGDRRTLRRRPAPAWRLRAQHEAVDRPVQHRRRLRREGPGGLARGGAAGRLPLDRWRGWLRPAGPGECDHPRDRTDRRRAVSTGRRAAAASAGLTPGPDRAA